MRTKTVLLTLTVLFILGLALTACGSKSTTQAPAIQPTMAPTTANTDVPPTVAPTTANTDVPATVAPTQGATDGKALLENRCTKCHTLDRVISKKYTADQWTKLVARMVNNGAKLTSDEQKILVEYLAKTYGQ